MTKPTIDPVLEYIKENHPDKLEIFETCQKLKLETECYWCYFESGIACEDLYAETEEPFVGVFKTTQNGYKKATQRVPYPSEDELIAVVERLDVSAEDLKKTKWQLLAEAYING